jgi:hypothetical protein
LFEIAENSAQAVGPGHCTPRLEFTRYPTEITASRL